MRHSALGGRRPYRLPATLLVLAAAAGTVNAVAQPTQPQPEEPIGAIVGGVLGAGIGVFGGAWMGYAMACSQGCTGDFAGLGAAITGAFVGEALLLPLGTHLGNGTAGNLALDVGVSFGMAAGTLLLASNTESSAIFTLGALGQLVMTVWAERSSAARKTRASHWQSRTRAFADGRVGFGMEFRR